MSAKVIPFSGPKKKIEQIVEEAVDTNLSQGSCLSQKRSDQTGRKAFQQRIPGNDDSIAFRPDRDPISAHQEKFQPDLQ